MQQATLNSPSHFINLKKEVSMKLKDKIKSYSFWVSLASAVILILKVLGSRFGFTVDESMVSDIFTALCSILVLMGIIVVPTNAQGSSNLNCKNKTNNSSLDKEQSNQSTPEQEAQNTDDKIQNISEATETANDETQSTDVATEIINEPVQNTAFQDNNFETSTDNPCKSETKNHTETEIINPGETEAETILDAETNIFCETDEPCETEVENSFETENRCEVETTKPLNAETEEENPLKNICNASNSSENVYQNSISENVDNLRAMFEIERNKFEENLNDYLSILHEEIEKISKSI